MSRPPPVSTLFPYTTLFRSLSGWRRHICATRRHKRLFRPKTDPGVPRGSRIDRGARQDTLRPETVFWEEDRKSTRLNSSHSQISYAVFCLKKKRDCVWKFHL